MDNVRARGIGTRDDRMRTCGTCGEDLIPYTQVNASGQPTSKVFWRHLSELGGNGSQHEPVVVIGPIRRWCDFCGPKTPACWSYQVIPVTTRQLLTTRMPAPAPHEFTEETASSGQLNDTPWYACADCAELIEQEQWGNLVRRAARVRTERTGKTVTTDDRINIHESHQQFRAMKTGLRMAIHWDC